MKKKYKIGLLCICLIICLAFAVSQYFDILKYELTNKSTLTLNLYTVNPTIKSLACDPSNELVLRVRVTYPNGLPVHMAKVKLSAGNNMENLKPSVIRTDENGEALVTYIPPFFNPYKFKNGDMTVNILSEIAGTRVKSELKIKLVRTPVILVHGYQASSAYFANMQDFLTSAGFSVYAINYNSEKGVAYGADSLNNFIHSLRLKYLSQGIQVTKLDIIAHSMGGLVARYYTCSDNYIKNNDVRKIIFISVPHRGSPLAPLGEAYFNDQGIKDLIPNNKLYTVTFPVMINRGLNSTIQVGSIYGQYDEVVDPESVSLDEWNIKTDVFAVGNSNFNANNILNGDITEATNHKSILSNKKVFDRILNMLNSELPYPIIRH